MQPEAPRVPEGLEQAPVSPTPNGERIPVLPTPEGGIETGLERVEQTAEASAAASDAAAVGSVPTPAAPPVVPDEPVSDSPAVAGDEDVIEKEWVDKAKKILLETKDDPFTRTTRVNELQKDYLKKRYNKDLGVST